MPLSQLTSYVSYVSQDNYLFDVSVRENIRMGRLTATDDGFDPLLIQTILNVILEHLQEAYADIMKVVWAEA